jgi:hypothetical protein
MNLDSEQRKKLRDALISAFPERSSLEQMLYFELGKNLNEITKDSNLLEVAFRLIQTAESQGWLEALIRAARKQNPGNQQLQAIAEELLPPEQLSTSQQKILVLVDGYLYKEISEIESVIRRVVKSDSFEIQVRSVIAPQDIRRAIGEERPSIVHFCTHGMENGNLVLKDNQGNGKPVQREVLTELLKLHADYLKCVLLNACYSFQSAKAISQHINYVISLEQSIQEKTSIIFAEGFYHQLGYGDVNNSHLIPRAFNEGIVALKLDCSKDIMPDLWNQRILQVGNLSSDCNVDYTRLRDMLQEGRWKEADYETGAVMVKAADREEKGWLGKDDVENFPCTDLRTIDQLWVKYSDGRFGFSVQKQIYLEVGGIPDDKYNEEAWIKLGERLGWRVKERWIWYSDVTFNTTAPRGHLPCWDWRVEGGGGSSCLCFVFGGWFTLLSRRDL